MNPNRMRNRMTRPMRGWQMAFGACLVAVLLATTSLTAGAAWGATGGLPGTGDKSFNPAADSEGNHCVSPEGVDANELLGISEYLMVPGACDVVPAGEFWVPLTSAWTMSPSWEEVPAGYTPSAPTPLEDFLSKVRSMTFTVDPGTARERSYRFAAPDIWTWATSATSSRFRLPTSPSCYSSQSSRRCVPATIGSRSLSR